jgi:hypothetical protein
LGVRSWLVRLALALALARLVLGRFLLPSGRDRLIEFSGVHGLNQGDIGHGVQVKKRRKRRGVRPENLAGNDGDSGTSVSIQFWLC